MRDEAASRPKPSAKNETGEYATFSAALKQVLSVSHSEIKSKIATEKRKRKRTKRPSASRVSGAKN